MSIPPLQPQVPIVDEQGRPTAQFLELWERLRQLVGTVEGVEGTYGAPTSLTVSKQGRITAISDT